MKHLFFFVLIGLTITSNAQLFTKVSSGKIVNTPSDSRGINFVDVNNDGYDDVFITNGPSGGDHNLLYINNGNGTFTSDTTNAIVKDTSSFDGATFGDVDNDGDLDAYAVTWYGLKNYFYRNNGSGIFSYEPTNVSGNMGTFSETASWGDYNKDGLLDLYCTNSGGNKKNLLYLNLGAGTFTQITTGAITNDANFSRCVNWTDYDNDDDLDVFVTNESNQLDDLYMNNNDGTFTKAPNVGPNQYNKSSMTASWSDIDNDGDLDVFIGNSMNYLPENNQLFRNNGNGTFTQVLAGPVVSDGGCTFGSAFADYDNDGDEDLFVSNGYCNGTIKFFLYNNNGAGTFAKDTVSLPTYTTPCSYGCAWSDLNNDGFQDLMVSTCKNISSSPLPNNILYMNNGNANKWLEIKLNGTVSNKNAIGAKIFVTATISGSVITQMREVSAQTGLCGQNSLTQHFGLGNASLVTSVQIKWPSGIITNSVNLNTDTIIQITEQTDVGIFAFEKSKMRLNCYPNPTNGNLYFEIRNPDKELVKEILIRDISGKNVKVIALNSKEVLIKVNESFNLRSGMYFAELISENGRSEIKFIIE